MTDERKPFSERRIECKHCHNPIRVSLTDSIHGRGWRHMDGTAFCYIGMNFVAEPEAERRLAAERFGGAAPEASPSPQVTKQSRAEAFRDLLIDTVMVLRFIIGQPPYKRGLGEYAGNDYCSWCATRKDLPHSKSCLRKIAIDVTNEWSALQ